MQEYKPFSKISGANFLICNNNFYDLYDILEDFKQKIEQIEQEIEELNEQLQKINIAQKNFKKRVEIKTKLLRQKQIANYFTSIFTTKFLKKVEQTIKKEKEMLDKQEVEDFIQKQNYVIKKMKEILQYFKQKEEQEKELEEYLQNNL